MQYMLLIYSNDSMNEFEKLSEAEQKAILGEYYAISELPAVRLRANRTATPAASGSSPPEAADFWPFGSGARI